MAAATNYTKLALKYGPVVYTLAQKYGPKLVEQMLKNREPAKAFVSERTDRVRNNPRKRALEHADSVIEGTLQQVFHRGQPYWVVFSRGEPVGTHPHTDASFDVLLLNADPSKRVSPAELRRTITLPRRPKK
ncbi:hypothetical protein GCM10009584_15360 [Ornithinimicrobium humiphilum]|uniref:Uncharacterized protein n=1 Tax=Ornithinimicrobium humiphilum TaxID=125288 RepID=A0A543KKL9_9MICO|nr:hypothetical protein [Ornithinimicrobium humiphilum]TQM95628.1 hypothetical protein FB476_0473 [Ornithinimicrobium humiphilum]